MINVLLIWLVLSLILMLLLIQSNRKNFSNPPEEMDGWNWSSIIFLSISIPFGIIMLWRDYDINTIIYLSVKRSFIKIKRSFVKIINSLKKITNFLTKERHL